MKSLVIAALFPAVLLTSNAQAADIGVGIPGLHLGMTLAEAQKTYPLVPEKRGDGPMAPPVFEGSYECEACYRLGEFTFGISARFDKSAGLEFFSLHQHFAKDAKLPDFAKLDQALSAKYGTPLAVMRGDSMHPRPWRYWLANGAVIETNHSVTSDFLGPTALIYYNLSDHGKKGGDVNNPLARGL